MSMNNVVPRFLIEAMLREEAEASVRLDGETYSVGPVTVGDPLPKEETKMPKTNHALMTPGEVATLFRVDPKTVTRWASAGKLRSVPTPGGHRRFYREDIAEMLGTTADEI